MAAGAGFRTGLPCIVCCVIIIILLIALLSGSGAGHAGPGGQASCACPSPSSGPAAPLVLPASCVAGNGTLYGGPAVPEPAGVAGLVLERPSDADLVPYTARNFSPAQEAAVAWWMSPGFMDNTSEFRSYERSDTTKRQAYPEEHRIFFSFIQEGLDGAEEQSVLSHPVVLFRGIGPSLAASVLNSTEYREPAFASTSYDITLSLGGFSAKSPDGYRNILVLERHPGEHAVYVNEDEREYLLPRGTRWHVVKAVNVENLTVTADFPLWNRTVNTASFDHVRLIRLEEDPCP